MYSIYALAVDGRVRYIGQTKDVQKRYKQHISPSKAVPWIQELLNKGKTPELRIVESSIPDLATAREREKHWIHFYEGQGFPLENWEHNAHAHSIRAEQEELQQKIYEKLAGYLSHDEAELLTRITLAAYEEVGFDAWDINYKAVVGTLKALQERYGLKHGLGAIDAAKITLSFWGYKLEDEAE